MQKYVIKGLLGSEVAYILCILGGFLPFRSVQGEQFHRAFLETLPGFTWLSFGSVILGAFEIGIIAVIVSWYCVWMHNTSLEVKR